MKLSFNQIKEITTGAVRVRDEDGLVRFYRFTEEQEELYKGTNQGLFDKTFATAGIKLSFKTDSENLLLKIITTKASSRKYFSADVFVNGKPVNYLDNFSGMVLPKNYARLEFPTGCFCKNFQLGHGTKTVCVHLPWSMSTAVEEISIDDNSFIEGIKPKRKLLAYGDSITQGYDAMRPSNRYVAKLVEKLDAEEYNKAIGGEIFFPDLAQLKDDFLPDYITVAYGTNDWIYLDEEAFKNRCREFYYNLRGNYPKTKIFAITPIWRKDLCEEKIFGPFEKVEENIKNIARDLKNITVIPGIDFIPQNEEYFGDLCLHPSDKGFEYYFQNLFNKIKEKL